VFSFLFSGLILWSEKTSGANDKNRELGGRHQGDKSTIVSNNSDIFSFVISYILKS
jgi:hypothetical protein